MGTINRIHLDGAQGHRDSVGQSYNGEGQLVNHPAPEQSGKSHRLPAFKGVSFSGLGSKLGSWEKGGTASTTGGPRMWSQEVLATADPSSFAPSPFFIAKATNSSGLPVLPTRLPLLSPAASLHPCHRFMSSTLLDLKQIKSFQDGFHIKHQLRSTEPQSRLAGLPRYPHPGLFLSLPPRHHPSSGFYPLTDSFSLSLCLISISPLYLLPV